MEEIADQHIAILLVDDDPDCRSLIREAIFSTGLRVEIIEAANGKTATDIIFHRGNYKNAARPALIFLDIEMPGQSGQDVLKQIRNVPSMRDIPVVMMSGLCDEDQMRLAARGGANSYTLKPANAEQFMQTVSDTTNYWLRIHQSPARHLNPELCRR